MTLDKRRHEFYVPVLKYITGHNKLYQTRLKELQSWRDLVFQEDYYCCLNNLRLQLYYNHWENNVVY
jgi:hypothetical protein